jgi:predicted nicotinamide N-methyase
MSEAATLLASSSSTPEELESALEAVVRDGSHGAFAKAFGPRRLMKALVSGRLTDRGAELADQLLSDSSTSTGLAPSLEFAEVLHHDELFPDEDVDLSSTPPALPDNDPAHLLLRIPVGGGRAYFYPGACRMSCEAKSSNGTPDYKCAPSLKLTSLSRRARLGSEIECKVWPAAIMLGRWMWQHQWLLRNRSVLELGAGVGTAGLAAAVCGASPVFLTDINQPALRCARENVQKNGPEVQAACRVAYLDWAAPPPLISMPSMEYSRAVTEEEVAAAPGNALSRQFELIIMADVINADGLSEMVCLLIDRTLCMPPLPSSPSLTHARMRCAGLCATAALPRTRWAGHNGLSEVAPPLLCREVAQHAAQLS